MARKPLTRQPWHPCEWEPADAYAFKALAQGKANEAQQRRALDWVLRCAGTYEPTFYAGQPDCTNFAEGARHVGLQVVKLVNMPTALIEKAKGPKPG